MLPVLTRLILDVIGYNPYLLPNIAARYSLDGAPSDATYLIDGSNRISLIADRSGNSAVNGLMLNGVAGNYASAPDSAALSITGDLELRLNVAVNSWKPSANQVLLSKYDTSSGNWRSYWLRLLTTGALNFNWSSNGSSATAVNSTATISANDFDRLWVRVTFDVDNGAGGNDVKFYTSVDGVNWTQLGTTVTTAGVATIFDSPAALNIGANDAGAFGNTAGIFYRAQIYNGIAGTLVLDANFTTVAKLAASFTEASANAATVTINSSGDTGARISGARDLVQLTQAKQPILSTSSGYNLGTADGSNDYLKSAPFALVQPQGVYLVGSQVSWTGNDVLCDGNGTTGFQIWQATGTPTLALYAGSGAAGNAGLAVGVTGVISALSNGALSKLGINRNAVTTGDAGANNSNGFTLGSNGAGGANANMTFSEVIVRSVADDDTLRLKIVQFLMKKWGIAA